MRFDQLEKHVQIERLISYMSSALGEFNRPNVRIRTDVIGIACQFGGGISPKPKRHHFDLIKNMTIVEIIQQSEKNYKNQKNKNEQQRRSNYQK